ncbi:hypothetical protein AB0O34_11345 [Sphaerisporangium sp. NPDC088356]|uniref:hypothetical protein n=1 Tax=Sphaerisporangium sp. NPDC088356 TaxID=3154871 RepID=UPI0034437FAE
MTSTPTSGGSRRRPVLLPVLAVLAAATVGVGAAFGGLEDAPKEKPEQLGKGAEVDQGRMTTLFEDAVVRPGGKDGLGISDKRYLQITMKVTNTSEATFIAEMMNSALVAVRADGKPIKEARPSATTLGPRVVTISGGHTYGQLHPGVPATVVMAFELQAGQQAPKRVEIDAGTYEWHESFTYRTHYWERVEEQEPLTAEDRKKGATASYTPKIIAQVDLPVRVEEV